MSHILATLSSDIMRLTEIQVAILNVSASDQERACVGYFLGGWGGGDCKGVRIVILLGTRSLFRSSITRTKRLNGTLMLHSSCWG